MKSLIKVESRNSLEKMLETDGDAALFMGMCFGAGSVIQIRKASTVLFRIRGDRNDSAFYHDTVFPMAKQYLANGVRIIDEKREKLFDGTEYTVPVIYSALRSPIKVFFRYAGFPFGDKPCSVFPKIFSDRTQAVKREAVKGLIATQGNIKSELAKEYRKLEFRNKTGEFLRGLRSCMLDAYGVNLSITKMRAALSPSDTMRVYAQKVIIHPHHLRYF